MDNPWGSPWADEEQPHIDISPPKDHGELRPATPVKASLGLHGTAGSPWNDGDEGFGDWGMEPVKEEKVDALGLEDGRDAWETKQSGATKGLDGLRWDDSTPVAYDGISSVAPSLMPITTDIVREPSPDPWAVASGGTERLEDSQKPRLDNDFAKGDMKELLEATSDGATIEQEQAHEALPSEPAEPAPGQTEVLPEPREAALESDEKDTETTTDHEPGHESSRPSSSPSEQSRHDPLSDSPRTSLDEEPKRPQAPRKVSSKIQELVEHFDGLAKQEEEPANDSIRSTNRSTTSLAKSEQILGEPETIKSVIEENDEEEDDDFGDFEEGQSDIEEPIEEIKRPITPVRHISAPISNTASPQSQASPPQSRYERKDYGRVEYNVNTDAMRKFTAAGDDSEDTPVERVFLMDTIPYDSFDTMEERKTWYRVSRYGSMRKHNSGDDDNYSRVTWPKSHVRDDILKTVARWIEEDRMGGRVALGGTSKGASGFGWGDPNALPVPLESIFATRSRKRAVLVETPATFPEVPREWPKGLVKDRSTSKSRSPKAKRRTSKSASISENHGPSPQAPVANFGWNAGLPTTSQSPIPLAAKAPNVESAAAKLPFPIEPLKPSNSSPFNSWMLGEPVLFDKPSELLTSPPTPTTTVADEDDEWGEMVASPVLATAPTLTPPQGLRHKKSQSLSGAFFSPPISATPKASLFSNLNMSNHRPTMSFHVIPIPQPRSSFDSTPNPVASNALSPTSNSFFNSAQSQAPAATNSSFDPRDLAFNASPQALAPPPSQSANTVDPWASAFNSTTQVPSAAPTKSGSIIDPWASADFSFFDTPAPAPAPKITPISAAIAKSPPLKAASFAKPPLAPSPLRHGKTKQEIEQDDLVAGIVKSLPDLSYMFRR